jgi:hypothetical protein
MTGRGGTSHPAALQGLAVALARQKTVVVFARALVGRRPCPHRLARVAAVFSFVCRLVDGGPPLRDDRVARLLWTLGRDRGPAVILGALLLALGERARVVCTREIAFVRVTLEERDLALLPPHARLHGDGRRLDLDPRRAVSPLGFLPRPVRDALDRRRGTPV